MGLVEHREGAPKQLGFAVITVSDTRRGAEDRGGAYLVESIEQAGHRVVHRGSVPDEPEAIAQALQQALQAPECQLVLFTGGTGLAPRDRTAEVLQAAFEAEIPGFGELFRMLSYQEIGPASMLSRACAGVVDRRVIVALPGSPAALRLAMERLLLPEAGHLVQQVAPPPGA
ncbi:MAG: molybdenum cofactor biosynthesis protein B [Planctomycetota bacterium]